MDRKFKYELDDKVRLIETEEWGTVIGRAEYLCSENNYYIRYKDATGKQVITWWVESSIRSYSG